MERRDQDLRKEVIDQKKAMKNSNGEQINKIRRHKKYEGEYQQKKQMKKKAQSSMKLKNQNS